MFPASLSVGLHACTAASLLWLAWTGLRRPDLLRFAALALVRRPGFTAVLFSTVLVCVLSLLTMGGYFQHSFWGLSESTIRSQTGHFQVARRGHQAHSRTEPWKWTLRDPEAVRRLFAGDTFLAARVETLAPELSFTGLVSNGTVSRTFLGRAVDPQADRKLSAFGESIVAGEAFLPSDRSVALVGTGLAQSLSVRPGTGLTLLTTTPHGSMASCDLDVKGVTESFSRDYDDVVLKVPLATLWDALGDTACDRVLVLLHDTRDLDTVLSRTRSRAAALGLDLEFRRWEELAGYYRSVRTLYTGIFRFFGAVLLGFAFVFLTSILEILFLQRRQEIALMRSFGAPPSSLLRRFLTESVLMGTAGTLLALGISLGLIGLFNLHGLEAAPPPGSARGYRILLRVLEEPAFLLQTCEFVLATTVLASVLPCLRGCRRPPLESLRHG